MGTLIKKLREALNSNALVRRLSAADKNTTVHWEFFNQVYDAAFAVSERWRKEANDYRKLSEWAEAAYLYLRENNPTEEGMELADKLVLIRMQAGGGPNVQPVQEAT